MIPRLRNAIGALLLVPAFAAAQPPSATPPATDFQSALQATLEASRDHRRGIQVHVDGARIAGLVREIHADAVVLSNREFERIVVRRDRISAVEGN